MFDENGLPRFRIPALQELAEENAVLRSQLDAMYEDNRSFQSTDRDLRLALAEAEAIVKSHEARIDALTSGAAKVRDQLAYHLERNGRLAYGYKRLRKAAELALDAIDADIAEANELGYSHQSNQTIMTYVQELRAECDDRTAFEWNTPKGAPVVDSWSVVSDGEWKGTRK